ncbi:MAG: FG-GAP repeat protein, partial [Acidimicrobiales bacterium]|nr:FG-GAP repeat protein [Acidimicrobiales bacterium]
NTDGTVKAEQKISATSGGFTGPLDADDRFGTALAAIGDVDGDGVTDLAVGSFRDDDGATDAGAVYVLFLNTDGTVKAEQKISATAGGLTGPLDANDHFGLGVGALGDLDGDGVPDIVVGATDDDDGTPDAGAVYVLFLNPDGTAKAEQKISNTAGGLVGPISGLGYFGIDAVGLGDVDGDGVGDVAVGAYRDDDGAADAGAVYVLLMNTDGTVKAEQKISNTSGGLGAILAAGDNFGVEVAAIGDVDGDAVPDLA